MGFLLIAVTTCHLIILAMLFIATTEKSWWTWENVENVDIWHKCVHDNSTGTLMCSSANQNEWLRSVQALMVLSVVLSTLSLIVFLFQLFTTSKQGLFYCSGLSQILAGLSVFSAVLIYTFHGREILQDPREGHFGYCFILAWVCVPLLLGSGVMYVHLRKKKSFSA